MKRSPMPPRKAYLTRARPITPKRRSADEFARIYHSKARVAWVKSLPCLVCGTVPSENAHTRINGMGKKAGYETIVPLCGRFQNGHHSAYDDHLSPFDRDEVREAVKAAAVRTEEAWQRHEHPNPEHIGPIVDRVLRDLLNRVGDDA